MMRRQSGLQTRLAPVLLASTALVFMACGGGDGNGNGNGDSGPGDGECLSSDDCPAPQVCQPTTQTCEQPGAMCTDHVECNGGTYCEASEGVCLPSSIGSPCAGPENCEGQCLDGVCGCDAVAHERQLEGGPLDIFLVLDRTGSMGTDCAYDPVNDPNPPVASKACAATYALANYVSSVEPTTDTRLALQVMSLSNDCTGASYDPAEVPLTTLPVAQQSELVQRISDEDFSGGFGTRIEGALRGIATFTSNHQEAGREMIGVLITDGDATACETNTNALAQIIADHRAATGIRTFIIGMNGASEDVLERLAVAGGADPHDDYCGNLGGPCHYFNVGDGTGDVLGQALQAISQQAVPLPCEIDVTGLTAPPGEVLDYGRVNVTFTQDSVVTTIGRVSDPSACPANQLAWYYDDPAAPTTIVLCQSACDTVSAAGDGANLNVVAGCTGTVVID